MTRYVLGSTFVLVMAWWIYALVFRYRAHVPYPELRTRWAKLPDPKQAGRKTT